MEKPIWISHRGYARKFTENTKGSFDAAIDLGFKIIETDLRTTADGHIVLFHDSTLEKLGDNRKSIEQLTRKEVSQIKYPCGSSPLFFDEFVAHYNDYGWGLDVKPESADRTIELLEKYNQNLIEQRAIFLCKTASQEKRLHNMFPKARFFSRKTESYTVGIALLLGATPFISLPKDRIYGVSASFLGISLFKPTIFQRYQRKGAKVIAYLPKEDEVRQAIDAGADMVLTDDGII